MKKILKSYIVTKLIVAESVRSALRKEKDTPVHEVFLNKDVPQNTEELGFKPKK